MSPLRLDWAEQAGWGYQTPRTPQPNSPPATPQAVTFPSIGDLRSSNADRVMFMHELRGGWRAHAPGA
jgi:hypothetical protein